MLRSFVPLLVLPILTILLSCQPKGSDSAASTGVEAAKVTRVTGQATLEREGKTIQVKEAGLLLQSGDLLRTGTSGRLDFEIEGRGLIQIGNDSAFLVKTLKGARSVDLKVQSGRALLVLKKLKADDQFTIGTPAAIAGVRGTSFQVSVGKEGSALSVLTGLVEFKNEAGKTVMVGEKKEALTLGSDLGEARAIRGSRLAEVKELLSLPGVDKMPDFEAMKANLKLLELDDDKSAGDAMSVKGDLKGQGVGGARTDTTENLSEAERAKVKKKADQFNSEKDMMLK